jgi:hypothetical protein
MQKNELFLLLIIFGYFIFLFAINTTDTRDRINQVVFYTYPSASTKNY